MAKSSSATYVRASDVAAWLTDPAERALTVVVDVRDGDFAGGHIAGARNIPSRDFEHKEEELLETLRTTGASRVVFHCMLSQVRGPAAASRFARLIDRSRVEKKTGDGSDDASFPQVHVLAGGFRGWLSFWQQERESSAAVQALMSDYDASAWEWRFGED